jgi:hypothetical protein
LKAVDVQSGGFRMGFRYDEARVPVVDVEWLSAWLKQTITDGSLSEGDTIQIGWMTNRLSQTAEGLHLMEPDFINVPIVFIDSVTRTLVDLRQQRDVVESVGMEPEFASIRESARICNHLTDAEYVMYRHQPQASDSGWMVACVDLNHDHDTAGNLLRESLYAIAINHPGVVRFLALPPGCTVERYDEEMSVYFNDRTLPVKPGSYLDKLRNE